MFKRKKQNNIKKIVSLGVLSLAVAGTIVGYSANIFSKQSKAVLGIKISNTNSISLPNPETPDLSVEVVTSEEQYVSNHILVAFKSSDIPLKERAEKFAKSNSLVVLGQINDGNLVFYEITNKQSVIDVVKKIARNSNVKYAEPDYISKFDVINTNDPLKNQLHGLDSYGQELQFSERRYLELPSQKTFADPRADIDAPEAWRLSEGNGQTVAVIDTGVAYNHPDLKNQMWSEKKCVDENGIFLGGCSNGYNFHLNNNDPSPLPGFSHGTHVAGTIAATKNNGIGVIGVAPQAKIMALVVAGASSEKIRAIDFARKNGVTIINASYGNLNFSQAEYDAIKRFGDAGGLFITTSGNDPYNNNDVNTHHYPCDYNLDAIICVNATDYVGRPSYSWGPISVDIGAPGQRILSTVNDSYLINDWFNTWPVGTVPVGWSATGDWAVKSWEMIGLDEDKVLMANAVGGATASITLPPLNLTSKNEVIVSFKTGCKTGVGQDSVMTFEASGDGINFTVLESWNEALLKPNSTVGLNGFTMGSKHMYLYLPNSYFSSATVFKFLFKNTSHNNAVTSCLVDTFSVDAFDDGSSGSSYGYKTGTSMAAPHVAGTVALVWAKFPFLTAAQVKRDILTTGVLYHPDSIAAYPTVSGRKLNAFNALDKIVTASFSPTTSSTLPLKNGAGVKLISGTISTQGNGSAILNTIVVTVRTKNTKISNPFLMINAAFKFGSVKTVKIKSLTGDEYLHTISFGGLYNNLDQTEFSVTANLSKASPRIILDQSLQVSIPANGIQWSDQIIGVSSRVKGLPWVTNLKN